MADSESATKTKQLGIRLTIELINAVNKDAFDRGNAWASHVIEDRLRLSFGLPPIHSQSVGLSA